MLKLYNTLTRDKQIFEPIVPGEARIYVCGMTVYDYCHLGHARVMVVFDMITRWLRTSGLKVTYVRNITDTDDKNIKRAAETTEPMEALTARFIAAMNEDAAALGVMKPDFEPRATEYIKEMQAIIALLEKKGLAYVAPDHDDLNAGLRQFVGHRTADAARGSGNESCRRHLRLLVSFASPPGYRRLA